MEVHVYEADVGGQDHGLEPTGQTSACGQLQQERWAVFQSGIVYIPVQYLSEEKLPVLVGRGRRLLEAARVSSLSLDSQD